MLVLASSITPEAGRSSRCNNPTKTLPGLAYRVFKYWRGDIDQAGLARAVALRKQPGGLVHGQTVVVLEKDFESRSRRFLCRSGDSLDHDRGIRAFAQLKRKLGCPLAAVELVVNEIRLEFFGKDERGPRSLGEKDVFQMAHPQIGQVS